MSLKTIGLFFIGVPFDSMATLYVRLDTMKQHLIVRLGIKGLMYFQSDQNIDFMTKRMYFESVKIYLQDKDQNMIFYFQK